MQRFWISIFILLFACSGENTEQAEFVFEEEQEDTSFYNPDTTNYLQQAKPDTAGLSLEDQFYNKYISMYFDDENYLVITLREGGVHFFDPHDQAEVNDVLKFKQFIEFRTPLPVDEVNGVSMHSLEQKIDSLLMLAE